MSQNSAHIQPSFLLNVIPCSAYARVKKFLGKGERLKYFDFGGVLFTLAVKERSSEILHIDSSDDPNAITWVLPLGDWQGGKFCVPQLNIKIPIRPGQVLGAMTRILARRSAPVTSGRGIIFTLFSDKFLRKHIDQ